MSNKRHKPEEVSKLRQVDDLVAQGTLLRIRSAPSKVTEVNSGTSCSTARSSPR
jgi:hypothetical protein